MKIGYIVMFVVGIVCAITAVLVNTEAGETIEAGLVIEGGNQRLIAVLFVVASILSMGMSRIMRRLG